MSDYNYDMFYIFGFQMLPIAEVYSVSIKIRVEDFEILSHNLQLRLSNTQRSSAKYDVTLIAK